MEKNMKKKTTISLLVVFAAALALAACGQASDGAGAAPAAAEAGAAAQPADNGAAPAGDSDLLTVSVVNWDLDTSFAGAPCEMYLYIQSRFGLTFDHLDVNWDNFRELPYLWAAAGTLPEIIGASDRILAPTHREWVEAGIIRSLPNDLSRWPTVQYWVNQDFVQALAINGNIYHIPRGTTLAPVDHSVGTGIMNRRDWREQLGIPVPQTEDDFIAMWHAFVDGDMHGDGTRVFGVYPHSPGQLMGQSFQGHGNTTGNWMWVDGQMVVPAFEESSLMLMSFWRRAFREGLVNPDFLTDPDSTSITEFAMGRTGTLLRLVVPVHLDRVFEQWVIFQPDIPFHEAVEILPPPRVPGREFVVAGGGAGAWSETLINSNVDDYTLERILNFYDWAMSEMGVKTFMFGFYGQDWVMDGDRVVMLTDINPETGLHFGAGDLYQLAAGGMAYLARWSGDAVNWFNPNISPEVMEMAINHRDNVILGQPLIFSAMCIRVRSIDIPEIREMGLLPSHTDEWVIFMTDNSGLSDQELWEQMRARWEANGLLRAYELMTAEVLARGYLN